MKQNAETKEKRKVKIDFLKTTFPNIKNMEVVGNLDNYRKIKQALFDEGFYKTKNIYSINDESIFKLILEAKEMKRPQRLAEKHNRQG